MRVRVHALQAATRPNGRSRLDWLLALAASAAVHAGLAASLLAWIPAPAQPQSQTAAIEVVVIRDEPSPAPVEAAKPLRPPASEPASEPDIASQEAAAPTPASPAPTEPTANVADLMPPAILPELEPPLLAEALAEPPPHQVEMAAIAEQTAMPPVGPPALPIELPQEPSPMPEPLPTAAALASASEAPRLAPSVPPPRTEANPRNRIMVARAPQAQRAERRPEPRTQVGQARPPTTQAVPVGETGMSVTAYRNLVMAELNRRKAYPDHARATGVQGRVVVAFAVGSSGRVVSLAITTSSGHGILDAAARHAVSRMSLPPPPGGHFASTAALRFKLDE